MLYKVLHRGVVVTGIIFRDLQLRRYPPADFGRLFNMLSNSMLEMIVKTVGCVKKECSDHKNCTVPGISTQGKSHKKQTPTIVGNFSFEPGRPTVTEFGD
jgi:hypothetical protein